MLDSGGSASPTQIKDGLKLRDLAAVRYHIRNLIHNGLVYEDDTVNGRGKTYSVQPFLKDEAILEYIPYFREFVSIALGTGVMCDAVGMEKGDCEACDPGERFEAMLRTIPALVEYLINFREDTFYVVEG